MTDSTGSAVLKDGDFGARVFAVQHELILIGYGIKPDYDYGPLTEGAVKAFQRSHGLPETGDVDGQTQDVLDLAAAAKMPKPAQKQTHVVVEAQSPSFLVPPSANWRGTIGRGLTADQFRAYVETLSLGSWAPSFVVLHNTDAPSFAQWHTHDPVDRMRNLTHHFRDEEGWQGGPHAFVADDLIWLFTPLWKQGTHAPSWNSISWGIEMVGSYTKEPFPDAVRDNAIAVIAALMAKRGLEPNDRTLRFHKEDPGTTHKDCPGVHVVKADIISRVKARMMLSASGEHQAAPAA